MTVTVFHNRGCLRTFAEWLHTSHLNVARVELDRAVELPGYGYSVPYVDVNEQEFTVTIKYGEPFESIYS